MSSAASYLAVPELLARAVERFADAPALVTRERATTFRDLGERAWGSAVALSAAGVKRGDRVLIVAPNLAATVHVWLGAILAGALGAAVNPELTIPELRYLAEDLDAALVVAEGERARDLGRDFGRPAA